MGQERRKFWYGTGAEKVFQTINQLIKKARVKPIMRNKVPALEKQPLKRGVCLKKEPQKSLVSKQKSLRGVSCQRESLKRVSCQKESLGSVSRQTESLTRVGSASSSGDSWANRCTGRASGVNGHAHMS